jgi:colanic acid/amylovoran biosynthesis protein
MSVLGGDGGKRAKFLECLNAADVLVVSGGGFVTDLFDAAERVLNFLMLAHSRGVPVFMFGQGIGPLRSSRLRKKAMRALPRVQSIALREKRFSYPLLRDLGVPDHRITVTGDDAVSLAYGERPRSLGKGIGVNLRVAYYSEISENIEEILSEVLSELANSRNVPLVPIPIAHEGEHSDVKHIRSIIQATGADSDGGASLKSYEDVIQRAGSCRVVVTGSYHGGVFALSQGVPVVALAKSKYYYNKFHGLADMFGIGCTVLQADGKDFKRKLKGAIQDAWERAPELRSKLLRAAEHQIDAANAAYDEMVEHLNSTSSG